MRSLQARDFLSMSKEELLSLPDEQFVLVFDDGELVTNTRRTIYSAFHWEVNRRYPQTPLTKACHVGNGVGPTPDTSQDILSVLELVEVVVPLEHRVKLLAVVVVVVSQSRYIVLYLL